jgi:hypothetical protein
MTNEEDNDQFTYDQIEQSEGRTVCIVSFLVIGHCLFIWSLEFGHWSLSS